MQAAPAKLKSETKLARVARCENCGAMVRNVRWTRDTRCPRCRSPEFAPLSLASDAVDYELADRAKGYAIEDIRLGKLAVWTEMINPTQYQEIMAHQNSVIEQGLEAPKIGDLLLKRALINRRQLDTLLRLRCRPDPDPDDEEFGQIAIKAGYANARQVSEGRQLQSSMRRQSLDAPPLALTLFEKHYLQENQIQAILAAQKRRGQGLMADVEKHAVEQDEDTLINRVVGKPGEPRRRLKIAGVCALPLAVVLLWWSILSPPKLKFQTQCVKCKLISAMYEPPQWPAECPRCKKREVVPMAICRQCGKEFAVEKPGGHGIQCPKCGSSNWVVIKGNIAQQVRDEIQNQKVSSEP